MKTNLPVVSDEMPDINPIPDIDSWNTLLMPQSIHARLSSACNLDCSFCERNAIARGDKDKEHDMTEEVWERLVAHFLPFVTGAELVGLGEPTLAKMFPRACLDVLRLNKTLYFATNGLFLDKTHVLDAVGEAPRLSVSVDAWDKESYLRVRGGDWDRLDAAIRTFRKEKPKAFMHSQYTASTDNIDGFPAFIRQAAEWGFQEVIFRLVQAHTVDRESNSLRFAKERTERALSEAWHIAQDAGLVLHADRRSYSEDNPDGNDAAGRIDRYNVERAKANPFAALRQYLDFVPFSDPTCGGDGTGDTAGPTETDGSIYDPEDPDTVAPLAIGEPEIILSDQLRVEGAAARSETTGSLKGKRHDNRPVVYSSAALISAWDGELWSCFAAHVVGNALTDTLHDVIHNPRYQAFLQNRQTKEGVLSDNWCGRCARTF